MRFATFYALAKKHLTTLGAVLTIITTLVGIIFSFDARYAKAEEVESLKQYVVQSHEYNRYEQTQAIGQLRKQQLEDKLFELRLKPHPTAVDLAIIKRYEDQLNDVNTVLSQSPPARPAMDVQQPK